MAMKDSDNLARLERLRPRYEELRNLQIRAETAVERAEADLAKAAEHARKVAGTDDEDEIRKIVNGNYEANTKALDEFEAVLDGIEKELEAIGNA